MSLRDAVRIAVLRTNPYWPFSRLNRIPYAAAVAAVRRSWRDRSEIRGVYLRNSLADGGWIPGSSDIDLTVAIHAGIALDDEYRFLGEFWRDYDRLRRRYPMIGEVDLVDEREIGLLNRAKAHHPAPARSTLLCGDGVADAVSAAVSGWEHRALGMALSWYLDEFTPLLAKPRTRVRDALLLRYARKFRRLLEPVAGEMEAPPPEPFEAEDMRGYALAILDRAARLLEPSAGAAPAEAVDVGDAHLTPALFAYLVRHLRPFEYRVRMESGAPAFAATLPPPDAAAMSRYARYSIPSLLLFPRGRSLIGGEGWPAALRWIVEHALLLALHLAGEPLTHDQTSMRALSRSCFAETWAELRRVQERLAAGDAGGARRDAFRLARRLSMDIRGKLSTRTVAWLAS